VPELALRLRRAANDKHMPARDSLVRQIRRWERPGIHTISERNELLYLCLGLPAERRATGVRLIAPEPDSSDAQLPAWAVRLREERCKRGWTKPQMALQIYRAGE
jgi:hypothetical protein